MRDRLVHPFPMSSWAPRLSSGSSTPRRIPVMRLMISPDYRDSHPSGTIPSHLTVLKMTHRLVMLKFSATSNSYLEPFYFATLCGSFASTNVWRSIFPNGVWATNWSLIVFLPTFRITDTMHNLFRMNSLLEFGIQKLCFWAQAELVHSILLEAHVPVFLESKSSAFRRKQSLLTPYFLRHTIHFFWNPKALLLGASRACARQNVHHQKIRFHL